MKFLLLYLTLITSQLQIFCIDTDTISILTENQLSQCSREEILVAHVKESISKAYNGSSKLTPEILNIDGMSSSKVRHLLNNLCSLPNTNYLEIGVWKGSTWISALYGNTESISSAVAIDNWAQFTGPKIDFLANCETFLPNFPYNFYSEDCFNIDVQSIFRAPINVYFFDGDHSTLAQELAFTYYNSSLDDVFIAVVDDWNFSEVPLGTKTAFKKLGYKIVYDVILPAKFNRDFENWWNGLYVAVVSKKKSK
jgi:hypothetical protein